MRRAFPLMLDNAKARVTTVVTRPEPASARKRSIGSGSPIKIVRLRGHSRPRPARSEPRRKNDDQEAASIGVLRRAALYPVLPLRDIVVFPHMIVPLFVGREKSINALEEVMRADKQILLATQKDAERRRSDAGGHLRDRHARDGPAAPEAPRRHREGAGRGRATARGSSATPTATAYFEAEAAHACRRRSARRSRSRRWPAPSSRSSRTT